MFRRFLLSFLMWVWNQADTILALVLAATCSVLGLLGAAPLPLLISATLGTLTVLAIALMRDRSDREKTQNRLNQLLLQIDEPLPERIFKYDIDQTSLWEEAEHEVWTIQETGNYILGTKKSQIISFLQRGGTVRVIVAAPTRELFSLLAFRHHSLTPEAIKARSDSFYHDVKSILTHVEANAERFQVRFTPYPVEITCTLTDPQHDTAKKRKAVVRYAGFRVPYDQRLDYNLQGDTSPKIFSHYFREAQLFFEHASKIVLISGERYSGKTTIIKQLIKSLDAESQSFVFFAITRPILSRNKCIELEVITSGNTQPRNFATRQNDGSYHVDTTIWTAVAAELKEAHKARKIIVLDEIGPMQLQSLDFAHIVEAMINDPLVTIFATIALENGTNATLKELKQHYRSTVLTLASNEHVKTEIKKNLEQEMKGSIYVVTRIPQTLYGTI